MAASSALPFGAQSMKRDMSASGMRVFILVAFIGSMGNGSGSPACPAVSAHSVALPCSSASSTFAA